MKIGEKLLKQLNKKFPPSSMTDFKFSRYDVSVKSDEDGNAVMLFIGQLNEQGMIKGTRFSRVLIKDNDGKILKDHWDNKGKV